MEVRIATELVRRGEAIHTPSGGQCRARQPYAREKASHWCAAVQTPAHHLKGSMGPASPL